MQKLFFLTFVLACIISMCAAEAIFTNVTVNDNGVNVTKVGYVNCSIVFYSSDANHTFIRVETNNSCANGGNGTTVTTKNGTTITVNNGTVSDAMSVLQGATLSALAAAVGAAFFIVA